MDGRTRGQGGPTQGCCFVVFCCHHGPPHSHCASRYSLLVFAFYQPLQSIISCSWTSVCWPLPPATLGEPQMSNELLLGLSPMRRCNLDCRDSGAQRIICWCRILVQTAAHARIPWSSPAPGSGHPRLPLHRTLSYVVGSGMSMKVTLQRQ